jgi:hypothetical protein
LKLNGTHQHLVYADDVSILGGIGRKKVDLEMNADNTKYIVMPRDQNVRRGHKIKIDSSSFETE